MPKMIIINKTFNKFLTYNQQAVNYKYNYFMIMYYTNKRTDDISFG